MRKYFTFIIIVLIATYVAGCFGVPRRSRRSSQRQDRIVHNKSEAILHYRVGTEHFVSGRLLEAKEEFQRSIYLDPTSSLALNAYGRVLQKLGRPVDAVFYYLLALEHDKKMGLIHFNIGLTARKLQDDMGAIKYFKKSVDLQETPGCLTEMGLAYYSLMKKYDSLKAADLAIDAFKWSLDLEKKNPDALFNLIKLYYHRGKFNSCWEAIKKYEALGFSVPFEMKSKVQDRIRQ